MKQRKNFRKRPKDDSKGLSVKVWNNNVEGALKVFKRKVKDSNLFLDLKKNPAILTGVNKETGAMHHQEIYYHKEHSESLINKAKEIVEKTNKKELMERAFSHRDEFQCRYCDWQDRCWRAE